MLLHYESPRPPNGPATLVQDAIFLDRNRTVQAGASLVAHYSGRTFASSKHRVPTGRGPAALQLNRRHKRGVSAASGESASPARSPALFLSPQRGLENLFQEVSDTLQKRTERWKVPRVVREAVGEVRRNMSNLPSGTASPRTSLDAEKAPMFQQSEAPQTMDDLRKRLLAFEKRNEVLARLIGDALEELRTLNQSFDPQQATVAEESFNTALAKIQFVQVHLADSGISIPREDGIATEETGSEGHSEVIVANESGVPVLREGSDALDVSAQDADAVPDTSSTSPEAVNNITGIRVKADDVKEGHLYPTKEVDDGMLKRSTHSSPQPRPGLAQSPLSWMLGEGRHRSDFVSSSTPPPEQRRDIVPKTRPKHIFQDGKDGNSRNGTESEDDGFTMSSLRGSQAKN